MWREGKNNEWNEIQRMREEKVKIACEKSESISNLYVDGHGQIAFSKAEKQVGFLHFNWKQSGWERNH